MSEYCQLRQIWGPLSVPEFTTVWRFLPSLGSRTVDDMVRRLRWVLRSDCCRFYARGFIAFLFALSVTASAAPPDFQNCVPSFPLKGGWLGADAAYSIPLPDGRVVWIFGDTLYGKTRSVKGTVPRMVRNSVGISTCHDGRWKIDYTIRKDPKGRHLDFFEAANHRYWYWALDGFFVKDALWVSLLRVRDKPVETSAAFAFETCGADLAKVTNLKAPPLKWRIQYFELVPDGAHAYPSATTVVEGNYAYLFALYEKEHRPMLLTRIPLEGLDAPKENLQFLSKDGTWQAGFDPPRARFVMEPGASEMSVRYHPDMKKWVAVMMGPGFPSDKIVLRTAPSLIGPWTEGQVIYQIPDVQTNSPHYDRDTFCYAGKEHPEFEPPGKILFTYVCNTLTVSKLTTNLSIYFPKTAVVPLKNEVSDKGGDRLE
ncbi:MAG TPA: DUF4185 domain-containing protein [Terriglobia bacterium]|nr:DUF4185 domain-containing protein [Terriglobia bacterium]